MAKLNVALKMSLFPWKHMPSSYFRTNMIAMFVIKVLKHSLIKLKVVVNDKNNINKDQTCLDWAQTMMTLRKKQNKTKLNEIKKIEKKYERRHQFSKVAIMYFNWNSCRVISFNFFSQFFSNSHRNYFNIEHFWSDVATRLLQHLCSIVPLVIHSVITIVHTSLHLVSL